MKNCAADHVVLERCSGKGQLRYEIILPRDISCISPKDPTSLAAGGVCSFLG